MILKRISSNDVSDFLSKNPDFFLDKPDILDKLNFPSKKFSLEKEKNVVTFKDWIINKLKLRQRSIINNAKHNYITQKKIHSSAIQLLRKNNLVDFMEYLTKNLPQIFDLEVVNIVTSKNDFCKKYNSISMPSAILDKIYNSQNHLVMDAVDKEIDFYKNSKKIYSNAIFSMDCKIMNSPSLLVFASSDNHFIDNREFDLIYFFSQLIQEKLRELM